MKLSLKKKLFRQLSKDNYLPFIAGVASGLYPFFFYFSNNYGFVNSFNHLLYFLFIFLFLPVSISYISFFVFRKKNNDFSKRIVLLVNSIIFFSLISICLKTTIPPIFFFGALFISLLIFSLSFYVKNLLVKVIIIQFILVLTTFPVLGNKLYNYISYSEKWLMQPDNISQTKFVKNNNVYFIQVDGYVNFSELKRGYYQYDNTSFEEKLNDKGFIFYENFRSNYTSTLVSNSSIFSMKHHYFKVRDAREVITYKNTVLDIFKNNNYKTYFLAESPYLLANKPKIGYDYNNIDVKKIAYLTEGLEVTNNILADIEKVIDTNSTNNFYFIEKILPGHIATRKENSLGADIERNNYLNKLEVTNNWLLKLLRKIQSRDPKALIVISADHGGFVGFEYSYECKVKTDDPDKLISAFSTILAIKWPDNDYKPFENTAKSNVNLFRMVISYLSQNEVLLKKMQENGSYTLIERGAPKGVYKVINDSGDYVFEKQE